MKQFFLIFLTFLTYTLRAEEPEVTLDMDKLSETFGHIVARHLLDGSEGVTFSIDKIIQGMRDEMEGKPAPLNEQQHAKMMALLEEKLFLEASTKNLATAEAFLDKQRTQEGVVAVDDKLLYEVLQKGDGAVVTEESIPLIYYEGTLQDGTPFSSAAPPADPIALPLKQTIPGFQKGLVGMKEGEKRRLYIHPELAYGVAGHLPPNSLLIFDVTIIKANSASEESGN